MRPIIYEELKVGDSVVTRDGRKGRVICTDMKGAYPIVCAISRGEGEEESVEFTKSGKFSGVYPLESPGDIFLPPKKEYVNLYRSECGTYYKISAGIHATKEEAETVGSVESRFIKTIEVEL